MSTFRVYGMTEAKARQLGRALPPKNRESIEEYEERVQERIEKLMNGSQVVPLSASFDAPSLLSSSLLWLSDPEGAATYASNTRYACRPYVNSNLSPKPFGLRTRHDF